MTSVAIVGYGYWGPNLLRNYLEVPGVSVAWVCDRRADALDKVRRRSPAQAVTESYDEVLADPEVDAVVIATPISTHFDARQEALRAGKHVFVEKPLTARVADAEELVALADETRAHAHGRPHLRLQPAGQQDQGADPRRASSATSTSSPLRVNLGLHQKDVSVVWDLAPHDLSILYYWLGESASSVYVIGRGCVVPEIPDVAFVNLRFPSGVVAEHRQVAGSRP